jgi:hypothetical protein
VLPAVLELLVRNALELKSEPIDEATHCIGDEWQRITLSSAADVIQLAVVLVPRQVVVVAQKVGCWSSYPSFKEDLLVP